MRRSAFKAQRSALRVFAIPLLLGALSTVGLLSALLGDDVWDALSWLALGLPCAVIAWFWLGAGRLGRTRDVVRGKNPV